MWLLLVAAGTGYLARCWQKSRKFKTGSCILRCNATFHSSQGSPSYTPRRGRSTTFGRRGLRKRSQSARGLGRKLLHGRKEGKLVTTHARDSDDNLGSPDKVDDSLSGEDFSRQCASDHGTPGQVQNSSLLFWIHGENHHELLRETSSCMENPLLSTAEIATKEQGEFFFCNRALPVKKPKMGSQNDGTRLEGSSSNTSENASLVSASLRQLVHAVPACPEFLRDKKDGEKRRHSFPLKLKKSTEQAFHFFAKVARGFGHRTCSKLLKGTKGSSNLKPGFLLNTRDVHVFKYLSYGKPYNKILLEELKKKQRFGPYFVHSQHLKALLDPEFFDHCRGCIYLPFSLSSYDLEKALAYSADFAGLSMATNPRFPNVDKVSGDWVHSLENSKPRNSCATCSRESHSHSFNEVSYVALGLAMGVLLVATGRSNELEDLHKLLRKNNTLIQELKKQIDSRIEPDPSKLPEVEKVPSGLILANITCSRKVHLHPEINSCPSAGEKDSLKLFNVSNNYEANDFWGSHAQGFDDLEAELEAELQLIELNGCNNERAECEWKRTQLIQNNWQPEGDDHEYADKPEGDEMSYVDIDIHDPIAIQDAGQVYESDFVVPPLELERRLWQVLEQRHEERICELENELRITQEKVTAKEMEVQWWKDRVVAHGNISRRKV